MVMQDLQGFVILHYILQGSSHVRCYLFHLKSSFRPRDIQIFLLYTKVQMEVE